MPSNLLSDMNSHSGGLEDQRALQIALELSALGINGEDDHVGQIPSNSQLIREYEESTKSKKSCNMTECVPVPSSEHVAEIVGRQGCKIKALRAKTNTYIKTPVRGEEPVFVVTGRKEDVASAKREILSAAEHFSQIRASRRNNSSSSGTGLVGPPSPGQPGQVTIQVRVPYRVVGLVVGPKGATIKRIQQQTHTYIVTPSRDKDPVFEVTGLPENVEKAKVEIESHIALRTGGMLDTNNLNGAKELDNDFLNNGIDCAFPDDLLGLKNNSAFTSYNSNNLLAHRGLQDNNYFTFPQSIMNGGKLATDFTNLSNQCMSSNSFGLYDDEGIGHSPSNDGLVPAPTSFWPDLGDTSNFTVFNPSNLPRRNSNTLSNSPTPRLSPSIESSESGSDHTAVRRIRSDPLSGGLPMSAFAPLPNNGCFANSSASLSSSTSTSPTDSTGSLRSRRTCYMCTESEVVAAFVPCGHNLFCMECANLIVEKPDGYRRCPVCSDHISQAIRIFS